MDRSEALYNFNDVIYNRIAATLQQLKEYEIMNKHDGRDIFRYDIERLTKKLQTLQELKEYVWGNLQ